jgi:hypothetical protein
LSVVLFERNGVEGKHVLQTRQEMFVYLNTEARSLNHHFRRKAISITYSEFVFVGLVIQHEKSPVGLPAVPYFSTLSHKRNDFREKVTERKICVTIFSTAFLSNISHFMKP